MLALCVFISSVSISAVDTRKRPRVKRCHFTHRYNQDATKQLKALFDELYTSHEYQANSAAMQRLLKAGANPNIVCAHGYNDVFLARAVRENDLRLTHLSLVYGANPNVFTTNPYVPKFPLMEVKSVAIAHCLLTHKANPLYTSCEGETLLNFFTRENDPAELLNFFCQQGIDPNKADIAGDTPLHNLLSLGCNTDISTLEKAAILLFYGADPRKKNNMGATVLPTVEIIEWASVGDPFDDLLHTTQALATIVPKVKREQDIEHEDTVRSVLSRYLPSSLSVLTTAYTGSLSVWSNKTWLAVQKRLSTTYGT